MAVRVYEGQAGAKYNEAVEVLRFSSIGPVQISCLNQGSNSVVFAIKNNRTGLVLTTDKDTAVADEDTGYDGDTSEVDFTGQALNNVPILPGSVTVKPTAGGDTVNATDRDGDGILYTYDDDEDACGTINYFTGAIVLAYPAGKAPNTGDIDADYKYQDALTGAKSRRVFSVTNAVSDDILIVKAAANAAGGAPVRVSGIATWE